MSAKSSLAQAQAEISNWILDEGRLMSDAKEFVQAFVEKMCASGVCIWRLRMGVRVLHPLLVAWGFRWVRGDRVNEVRVRHGIETTEDFIGSPVEKVFNTQQCLRVDLTALNETDHSVLHQLAREGATDYFCIPIRFTSGDRNFVIYATDNAGGFCDDEIELLVCVSRLLGPVMEVMATRFGAQAFLDTYVGPRTGARIMQGAIKRGDGEIINAALWFSDLRDFTVLTETLSMRDLLATLNEYFELVDAAVSARGGEILRFIGDAMLIVFPVTEELSLEMQCQSALEAANDAINSLAVTNHRRRTHGQPEINFGVGLHAGRVIYGNVGAPQRLDFTVMGIPVNLTARLESLTKKFEKTILCSSRFNELLGGNGESLGFESVKGVAEQLEVFVPSSETV